MVATGVRCAKCRNRRVLTALRSISKMMLIGCAQATLHVFQSMILLQHDKRAALRSSACAPMREKECSASEDGNVIHRQLRNSEIASNAIREHSRKNGWEICGLTRLDDGGR